MNDRVFLTINERMNNPKLCLNLKRLNIKKKTLLLILGFSSNLLLKRISKKILRVFFNSKDTRSLTILKKEKVNERLKHCTNFLINAEEVFPIPK